MDFGDRYKVVRVDNFDRETIAQQAVVEYLNEPLAELVCASLREGCTSSESAWYQVFPQSKPLWRGMAEFVD